MAQQIVPAAQLILRFNGVRRCSNYVVLQNIPCSPEYKIMGQILLDHPLSYALTATTDVLAMYLKQFWKTVSKVPNTKDTIKFKLDTQKITYTVDMFHDTLHFPVETPDNPFIAPVNIKVIKSFMQTVGYQGVINKKFPSIPQILEDDYHSLKDDILLKYEKVFFRIEVSMNQPQPVFSTQGTHRTTPRAHRTPILTVASPHGKKRKQSAGEISSLIKLLKVTIKQKQVVKGDKDEESYASKFDASMLDDNIDDSDKQDEKKDDDDQPKDDDVEKTDDAAKEKENDDHADHTLVETHATGSMETRNEQM
nr:hypothetical protein [Tanacetum cinerariifolium]